jgi:flagellar biosynthesis/type III secretory pathway M-ring protein FliF/YscJ
MDPTDPLHPNAAEAAMSLEVALVVLAIGAIIFVFLIGKLVAEYRARRDQQEAADEAVAEEPETKDS